MKEPFEKTDVGQWVVTAKLCMDTKMAANEGGSRHLHHSGKLRTLTSGANRLTAMAITLRRYLGGI